MWRIRPAVPGDEHVIPQLAIPFRERISPYVLNPTQVRAYLDEWLVAEAPQEEIKWLEPVDPHIVSREEESPYCIGGSIHYVTSHYTKWTRNRAYLIHMKLVPEDLVDEFGKTAGAFLSQLTCPGRGSLRVLVNHLKGMFPELWSWLSISNASLVSFYERELGLRFEDRVYTFMNTYKGDWSNYKLGRWKRQDS